MNQTLYRITDPAGWPEDAAWLVLRYDKADVEDSGEEVHTVTVGIEAEILHITGDSLKTFNHPHHATNRETLVPIGSFETRSQMIDLMTPILVRMATFRLAQELGPTITNQQITNLNRTLNDSPYENACAVLNATPEELKSWAEGWFAAHRGKPTR